MPLVNGNIEQAGMLAPVEQRIGTRPPPPTQPRHILPCPRPDLLHEKTIRDDVRKMPERADEQQPLARPLNLRSESLQVDSIRNHHDVGATEQRAILLRHHHHFAIARNPLRLEPPPPPVVPA